MSLGKNLLEKLTPQDIIAFFIITGVIFLNWKGVQTMLNGSINIIVGFYFGHKIATTKKND